jgi:hypothetical protein
MRVVELETRHIEQRRAPNYEWEYIIQIRVSNKDSEDELVGQIRLETLDSSVVNEFQHRNDLVAVFMTREEASILSLI